ncbi:NADP-dependent 3-hydroxy acid dehydrogenase YdfG [Candidatus Hepatoplasma crinochetorum Av]|uniref:NADP-dependent 3-hydroxy acid dehydrogenase YdfG n=1 Tax=Candidatus Hepatoplasma crinochetorum Av TaxID=1427984 RepID=W8GEX2_9MOLU|nr:SDR family NAD(P)-dependent oxidoreductase [Candidatus Hepatoplasma crinochetorum]AHK22344.1 NADP-dependent 3-hydroxy acid dehydrogenase YdfG [Candidatus Hepatoplasma crinochetorum Av]
MKYTVITGASSGIGKAIATYFASKGHNIIIVARRKELLDNLKKELEELYKIKVLVYIYDLSITENVYKFYDKIKNYELEVLINNAGFGDINEPWKADLTKINKMIDLNIKTLTDLTLLFIKDNINKETQIINVSSAVGYFIWSSGIPYSATKFYVSTFTEGIAKLLKRKDAKLKIKILAPAGTESEFLDRAFKKSNIEEAERKETERKAKKGRKKAEELAYYTYELYLSDKTIGIVNPFTNKFKLKNKWYDIF